MSHTSDRGRRRLLRGAVTTATALSLGLLAACGSDQPAASTGAEETEASGPWSYTDDLGKTIELDEEPTRIAAYGDAAAALMGFGVEPVALYHYMDPSQDSTFDDIDLSHVEVIGTSYGEINVEQLAAADPDLIVTVHYDESAPEPLYGFKDVAQQEQIEKIAPIATVLQTGTALDVIESNERLVEALGVHVEGGQVAEDRATFEQAAESLTEAASSGVSVLPLYGEDANVYFAIADDDPGLSYYESLGVSFMDVGGKDDYYWETVSWENADKYDADLLLYSVRDSYTPEQLLDQPTFARLKAAQADQMHPWKFKSMDYASQASYMNELAGVLADTEKVG
jgi:iron complex transport system substrate-binding protein